MDGLSSLSLDKGLKAQVEAAKRDYIVEPRLGIPLPSLVFHTLLLRFLDGLCAVQTIVPLEA